MLIGQFDETVPVSLVPQGVYGIEAGCRVRREKTEDSPNGRRT